jgi:hypothetical protein
VGTEAAVAFYAAAKTHLGESAFESEINWQASRTLDKFTEQDLIREAAWVILCSGFRESVVRNSFSFISLCFCEWESAATISANSELCRATALAAFRNQRKIDAIVKTACYINAVGFDSYRAEILDNPIVALRRLPYIGGVTVYHLAKNLGADVAKPDRHLVRLAVSQGFCDVHSLCSTIAKETGDPLRVVDIILWRFLVQRNVSPVGANRSSDWILTGQNNCPHHD